MRTGDLLARPLLGVALGVLTAGVGAASFATTAGASAVVGVAGGEPGPVRVVAAVSSEPVTIVLAAAVTIDSTTTTAPAPSTTTTTAAATATTATTAPQPVAPTAPAPQAPAPTTATTATAAPPPAGVDTSCERYLFERTNEVRAQRGLPALAFDSRPHAIAREWSSRMASSATLAHNPNYARQLSGSGVNWSTAGENVGRGDLATIFEMWMASPSHARNIVSADFTAFAVGCVAHGGQVWATQNFYG